MSGFTRLGAWAYGLFNRDPASNQLVVTLARLTLDDRVLDIGCGPGAAVARAAAVIDPARVIAVDPTPAFIEQVRRRIPGVDARLGDAEALPCDDNSVTVAWSVSAMHHWPDRDTGLADALRVLAPGGRLLLMERSLKRSGHGITPSQADEVMARLKELGATAVDSAEHRAGRRTYLVITATA